MEEVKKRGRPPKAGNAKAAALAREELSGAATIPKKRGRPAKGKGRGRPPKNAVAENNSPTSDMDGDGPIETNGGSTSEKSPKRLNIVATGKGRGRPAIQRKSTDSSNESDEDYVNKEKPAAAKSGSPVKRRKLGRPKKHQPSDEENDSDTDGEERRPVGRPATGAINLNIARTGRGLGRPRKAEKRDAAAVDDNANGAVPKKRGRPALGNKPAAVPTGRPRGRPKSKPAKEVDPDADDADEVEEGGSQEDEKSNGDLVAATPKKRGRPLLHKKANPGGKPRGRPPKNAQNDSVEVGNDDDDMGQEDDSDEVVFNARDKDEDLSDEKATLGKSPIGKLSDNANSNNLLGDESVEEVSDEAA